MKQEEINDISTILIEATDERSAVMSQVSKQTKPVIIVLPEQANQIFRQPGDFFELKRLKRERGLSISLVISGHERIRSMARRQGFQVYTSAETCARAMARRGRLYSMRGISLSGTTSLVDQPHFMAQVISTDEDAPPWSYDIRMQQPATTPDDFIAHEGEQGEDTPWSYDVQMCQAASIAGTQKTLSMQGQETSGDDVPWSYDVQMQQNEATAETAAEEHPQRTAWMLAEEELWNQKNRRPLMQHDQPVSPSYMLQAPYAGALNGDAHLVGAGQQPEFRHSASLGDTPIPPYFTETLQNLVALSSEKSGSRSDIQRASLTGPLHSDAHRSGPLDAGAYMHPTRLIGLPDETPTRPVPLVKAQPRRYTPDTEPLNQALETWTLTNNGHTASRLALMLTALLILGILGGVCCGYILTLMHVNLTVFTSTISSL